MIGVIFSGIYFLLFFAPVIRLRTSSCTNTATSTLAVVNFRGSMMMVMIALTFMRSIISTLLAIVCDNSESVLRMSRRVPKTWWRLLLFYFAIPLAVIIMLVLHLIIYISLK